MKPREWVGNPTGETLDKGTCEVWEMFSDREPYLGGIHVIEKSAYDDVVLQLRHANNLLQGDDGHINVLRLTRVDNERLKSAYDEAVKALQTIATGRTKWCQADNLCTCMYDTARFTLEKLGEKAHVGGS